MYLTTLGGAFFGNLGSVGAPGPGDNGGGGPRLLGGLFAGKVFGAVRQVVLTLPVLLGLCPRRQGLPPGTNGLDPLAGSNPESPNPMSSPLSSKVGEEERARCAGRALGILGDAARGRAEAARRENEGQEDWPVGPYSSKPLALRWCLRPTRGRLPLLVPLSLLTSSEAALWQYAVVPSARQVC